MTPLQQRFLDAIEESKEWASDYEGTIWKVNDKRSAVACEKIAEEFAAAFKDWCDKNEYEIRLDNIPKDEPAITTKGLIQKFKEQGK